MKLVDHILRKFGYAKLSEGYREAYKDKEEAKSIAKTIINSGICPMCLEKRVESIPEIEYRIKYEPKHRLEFGKLRFSLCDYHLKQLYRELKKFYEGEVKEDGNE